VGCRIDEDDVSLVVRDEPEGDRVATHWVSECSSIFTIGSVACTSSMEARSAGVAFRYWFRNRVMVIRNR
jgi:hypothetical protein